MEYNRDTPIVGRDVPLESVKGDFLRVLHFLPLARVEDGKIRGAGVSGAYASLTVEGPPLAKPSVLLVGQKIDFKNLWAVLVDRGIGQEEELLISYAEYAERGLLKFISGGMPHLYLGIYPKGSLERINFLFGPQGPRGREAFEQFPRPIWEWKPEQR
jgi:hypothetical protein